MLAGFAPNHGTEVNPQQLQEDLVKMLVTEEGSLSVAVRPYRILLPQLGARRVHSRGLCPPTVVANCYCPHASDLLRGALPHGHN